MTKRKEKKKKRKRKEKKRKINKYWLSCFAKL